MAKERLRASLNEKSMLELSIDETPAKQARLVWDSTSRVELRHAMEDAGIPIVSLCLSAHRGAPLGSHNPTLRARAAEIFTDAVDLAADLGIRIIQLACYDVYYEESDDATRRWFAEGLKRGVDYAAARAIKEVMR